MESQNTNPQNGNNTNNINNNINNILNNIPITDTTPTGPSLPDLTQQLQQIQQLHQYKLQQLQQLQQIQQLYNQLQPQNPMMALQQSLQQLQQQQQLQQPQLQQHQQMMTNSALFANATANPYFTNINPILPIQYNTTSFQATTPQIPPPTQIPNITNIPNITPPSPPTNNAPPGPPPMTEIPQIGAAAKDSINSSETERHKPISNEKKTKSPTVKKLRQQKRNCTHKTENTFINKLVVDKAIEKLAWEEEMRGNTRYLICNEGPRCVNKPIIYRGRSRAIQHLQGGAHSSWYKRARKWAKKKYANEKKDKEAAASRRHVIENNETLSISASDNDVQMEPFEQNMNENYECITDSNDENIRECMSESEVEENVNIINENDENIRESMSESGVDENMNIINPNKENINGQVIDEERDVTDRMSQSEMDENKDDSDAMDMDMETDVLINDKNEIEIDSAANDIIESESEEEIELTLNVQANEKSLSSQERQQLIEKIFHSEGNILQNNFLQINLRKVTKRIKGKQGIRRKNKLVRLIDGKKLLKKGEEKRNNLNDMNHFLLLILLLIFSNS